MKESGIGFTASIADGSGSPQVITNDITNLAINLPRANQDTTGIDKSAPERILLLADMSLSLNGVFTPSADKSHAVFKTVPSQAPEQTRAVSLAISSQTFTAETIPDGYALTLATGGALTWAVTLLNANGAIPSWS